MRRTLNCIICGKPATNHAGHVHLPDGKKICSGLCEDHKDHHEKITNKYMCKSGCDGDYEEWMKDSKKETQDDLWLIVDRQSLQQSKDMFVIKRKGENFNL